MAIRVNRSGGRNRTTGGNQTALPNEPANASEMRSFVAEWLSGASVPEHVADEILLAVGEVVANACRHGRRPTAPGEVALRCEIRDSHVAIAVTDEGPGFDVKTVIHTGVPDLLSAGGRGFFLMRQLMDSVDVESSSSGTTVCLERKLIN